MASQEMVHLTTDNFETEVLKNEGIIIVDFWADWCGPCRIIAPILEKIAEEFAGKVTIGKVNVDQEGSIAQNYNIRSIPTLIFFKNGQEEKRTIGVMPKNEIAGILTDLVK